MTSIVCNLNRLMGLKCVALRSLTINVPLSKVLLS